MIHYRICIPGIILLLAGCVSQIPRQMESLKVSRVCCQTVKQISYERKIPDLEERVTISEKTSSYDFPEGKSFFKAYELPENVHAGDFLRIGTYFNSLSSNYMFYPYVLFLDGEKNVIRRSGKIKLLSASSGLGGYRKFVLDVQVEIGTKYIIVYTDTSFLGTSVKIDSYDEYAYFGAGLVMPTGAATEVFTELSPIGDIGMEIVAMRSNPQLAILQAAKEYRISMEAWPSSVSDLDLHNRDRTYYVDPEVLRSVKFRPLSNDHLQVDVKIGSEKNKNSIDSQWVVSLMKVSGADGDYFHTNISQWK